MGMVLIRGAFPVWVLVMGVAAFMAPGKMATVALVVALVLVCIPAIVALGIRKRHVVDARPTGDVIDVTPSRKLSSGGLPVLLLVLIGLLQASQLAAQPTSLQEAQRHFYNGRYEAAADAMRPLCAPPEPDLDACELRTSSLLFQIKRLIGEAKDKNAAWKACSTCPALMSAFLTDTNTGRALTRARLAQNPSDESGLFFLGKLNLNYVWLQSGTLGRKTGWSEYWEARRSLDKVLIKNPDNLRARVARAWIDYIVGTEVPRGVRWLLGGGNRKRGLLVVHDAATEEADFFVQAETMFALWDMQVREKRFAEALATARDLVVDFPDNQELHRFIDRHGAAARHE